MRGLYARVLLTPTPMPAVVSAYVAMLSMNPLSTAIFPSATAAAIFPQTTPLSFNAVFRSTVTLQMIVALIACGKVQMNESL